MFTLKMMLAAGGILLAVAVVLFLFSVAAAKMAVEDLEKHWRDIPQ